MTIPAEALAATLKAIFDKSQPWVVETETMTYRHSGRTFTFTHSYRQATVKALVVRLVRGWGKTFISLAIDPEKADSDETEIGAEIVQMVVNILAARMRPQPVNFVVLSFAKDSTREIVWA